MLGSEEYSGIESIRPLPGAQCGGYCRRNVVKESVIANLKKPPARDAQPSTMGWGFFVTDRLEDLEEPTTGNLFRKQLSTVCWLES